jgi:hypothetical protein
MALYAGESTFAVQKVQAAGEIVREIMHDAGSYYLGRQISVRSR